MKSVKISLAWQILIALVLGIIVGAVLHNQTESREWLVSNILSPAGDIFIRLIKMIVVPIVISTLIVGIAGVGDAKKLGRIGLKTIIYFEVITTVAIVVGLTLANVFQPGHGIDMSTLTTVDISQYEKTTEQVQSGSHSLVATILSLIPSNVFSSMAKGDMLPIIFFSVLFGLGLSSLPKETKEPLLKVFKAVSESMFKVTHMIMRYAPIGVFGLIAVTVANFGFASLLPLAKLVVLVYFAIAFFALVVLGAVARLCNLRIWTLIRILKDELIPLIPPPARKRCCRASSKRWRLTARPSRSPASWCRPATPLTWMARRCTRASPPSLSPSCTASSCRWGRRSCWC